MNYIKKIPPSTIMKSYQFIMHLEDLTCAYAKISRNTTEELVHNLKKGSHERAKILTLPMPLHAQASL